MSKKTIAINCVFFGEKGCNALRGSCVEPATCPFRKTEQELDKSKGKANARLQKLPLNEQKYIAERYFKNKRVWNK